MEHEFPQLGEMEDQKEFLRDWWSPKKLYKGNRASGKTTMMLCELRRFERAGFSCLFLAPTNPMLDSAKRAYSDLFGEHITSETGSYYGLGNGEFQGNKFDVIIADEFQDVSLEIINREMNTLSPLYIRASACMNSMNNLHYLAGEKGDSFFDSVYYSDL